MNLGIDIRCRCTCRCTCRCRYRYTCRYRYSFKPREQLPLGRHTTAAELQLPASIAHGITIMIQNRGYLPEVPYKKFAKILIYSGRISKSIAYRNHMKWQWKSKMMPLYIRMIWEKNIRILPYLNIQWIFNHYFIFKSIDIFEIMENYLFRWFLVS